MTPIELFFQLIGSIIALCFVSYIFIGESYLYYFAENVIIGGIVSLGIFSLYVSLRSSAFIPISSGAVILIIPLIIGILAFARFTKHPWLTRFPIAIVSGIGIGVSFGQIIRSQILGIITSGVSDIKNKTPDIYSAIFLFVGVIAVLTYFLYSQKVSTAFHSPTGPFRYVMKFGRYCLMASFGYLTGYIVVGSFGTIANIIVVVIKRFIDELFIMFH